MATSHWKISTSLTYDQLNKPQNCSHYWAEVTKPFTSLHKNDTIWLIGRQKNAVNSKFSPFNHNTLLLAYVQLFLCHCLCGYDYGNTPLSTTLHWNAYSRPLAPFSQTVYKCTQLFKKKRARLTDKRLCFQYLRQKQFSYIPIYIYLRLLHLSKLCFSRVFW